MSMPTTAAGDVLAPLRGLLGRLRARLKKWVLVDGSFSLLAGLVVLIVVDFVVDWAFAMDRAQRIVMMGLAIAALLAVALRRLVMPLWRQPTDDALCLKLERRNRHLGESLISCLQFARIDDTRSRGISSSMVQAAIQEGVRSTAPLDVDSVLNLERYRKNIIGLVLVGMALAGVAVAVAATETGSIWFQRNVLLRQRSWPQDTYLRFAGVGDQRRLRIPSGMNWPLTVMVTEDSTRVPDDVMLEVEQADHTRSETMQAASDERRFTATLRHVTAAQRIRAVAGRVATPWIDVEPVEFPAVTTLELATTLPAYAGAERHVLEPGKTLGTIVEGSQLSIRGESSKPLAAAQLVVDRGDGSTGKVISMEVSSARQFHVHRQLTLADSGHYALRLVDKDQILMPGTDHLQPLTNSEAARFRIRVRQDSPPAVRLLRGKIGPMIVPAARIPFSGVIEDEFGLTQVRLITEWSIDSPDGDDVPKRREAISLEEVAAGFEREHVIFNDELDLRDGDMLPVGAELMVSVEATDNNDLSGPNTGTSAPLRFRIVSTAQLRTELLHRESVIRRALANQQIRQIGILADSQDLLRRAREDKPFGRQELSELAQLQKRQKQLAATLVSMTDRLNLIRSEFLYNRLGSETSSHSQRLASQVIDPLENLIATTMPESVLQLDRSRRSVEDAEQLNGALTAAVMRQQEADRQLQAVIASMIEDVEFQLVLDLLREVHGSQKDVLRRSEEERRRLIQEFLEKNAPAGNPPAPGND